MKQHHFSFLRSSFFGAAAAAVVEFPAFIEPASDPIRYIHEVHLPAIVRRAAALPLPASEAFLHEKGYTKSDDPNSMYQPQIFVPPGTPRISLSIVGLLSNLNPEDTASYTENNLHPYFLHLDANLPELNSRPGRICKRDH